MLVPGVAGRAADELSDLRAAAVAALSAVLASRPDRLVVLGSSSPARHHVGARRAPSPDLGAPVRRWTAGTGSMRGFGVGLDVPLDPAAPSSQRLGLALTVGAWLLGEAGWGGEREGIEVDPRCDVSELEALGHDLAHGPGAIALLAVADGSASRSDRAPASLHPDAEAFDAAVADALRDVDPVALKAIERSRAAEVSSTGWPAWHVAAVAASGSTYGAELLADVAPYGVGYLVARWLRA
jgi:hypothetical protein